MIDYEAMAKTIEERISSRPDVALILGSGLGYLTGEFQNPVSIDYSSIPGFLKPQSKGTPAGLFSGSSMVCQ